MSRRALISLTVLTICLQWLSVVPVLADDQSSQTVDPIVQAQWSALVEAASNAQGADGNAAGATGTSLNGSASVDSSGSSLLVPQVSNVGNSGGVDIINESLKYHNPSGMSMQPGMNNMQGNFRQAPGYGQMGSNFNGYGMQNGMANNGMMNNGMSNNGMMNGGMMNNGMMNNGMMNGGMMNNGMANNFVMPAGGYPMQNQMMMNSCPACQHQNHCCGHGSQVGNGMMNNGMSSGSQDGINTQAIGVLGAGALMGVLMQKGGVGGILQDMGWDGSRHIRGSSIGGY